jgi:polyhydroxyalkanoate synthesis regulator phasin
MLSGLPIPTQSETDSLYQEIHRLKRRLRALEKQKA